LRRTFAPSSEARLPAKIDKDRVTTDAGVLTLDSVQGVSFIAE
jgi:hypothetical protein